MSRLVKSLTQWLKEHLLEEKWLMVANRRVGIQIIDRVSLTGSASVNLHIKTFPALIMDLMGNELQKDNLRWLDSTGGSLLIEELWRQQPPKSYFSNLHPGPELFQALFHTFESLRITGLSHNKINLNNFEVPAKGEEILNLYQAYETILIEKNLIDYAGILHRCLEQKAWKSHDVYWIMPEDMLLNPLEKKVWQSLPKERRHNLPVDQPTQEMTQDIIPSQLESLRWLPYPANAPTVEQDQTVAIFRAVGESNEVREVLRRCLTHAETLDQIEILYSHRETYLPLFYEIAQDLELSQDHETSSLPITFSDGIPTRYSKPGRALMAWVDWILNDYPQSSLLSMLREQLIQIPNDLEKKWQDYDRLATLLRRMPIGFGKDRYLEILDSQRRGLEEQIQGKLEQAENEDFDEEEYKNYLQNKINGIHALTRIIQNLLDHSIFEHPNSPQILECAQTFLLDVAHSKTDIDNYSRGKFINDIKALREWLQLTSENTGLDLWQWLSQLPLRTYVMGSGPRPGHLHVANLYSGGYSGRPHTYILGLDDSRFPGGSIQDPLLLDKERSRISHDLPHSRQKVQDKINQVYHLIARLRGKLTLSYSCYDLIDDRELFPANIILSAYRILSGNPNGDQSDLMQWLEAPASFAPYEENHCTNESQWWLWRFCQQDQPKDPRELLTFRYPHLQDGFMAQFHRESENFTEFDGYISNAGEILSPKKKSGLTMSASSFENLGKCPLRFFYHYVLEIQPPDELTIDPERWLDHAAYGNLLHQVFEQFYSELLEKNELPSYEQHYPRLREILMQNIEENRKRYPPPSEDAFQRQYGEFLETINIFLKDEEEFCQSSQPCRLEADIGMDKNKPWWIHFPDGSKIKVRGRLDRLDCIDSENHFYALWDYKTGRPFRKVDKDPFLQGRLLQHILYLNMTESWIKENISSNSQVKQFGFFFPSVRGEGERLSWNKEDLREGQSILVSLTSLIDSGSFLATNTKDDCIYCDYQPLCGDLQKTVLQSQRKMLNPKNSSLKPFMILREKQK